MIAITAFIAGSAMFGAGWGLAGFCPGPAVMNLATLQTEVWLFVAAMVIGMLLYTPPLKIPTSSL